MQNSGGISVYWKELIDRIDKTNIEKLYLDYSNYSNIESAKLKIGNSNIRLRQVVPLVIERYLSPSLVTTRPSLFHSSYYRTVKNFNIANIITIHDFVYEYGLIGGPGRFLHLMQKKKSIERAKGIICISENTKNDLLKFYPFAESKKIRVIYNGVNDIFHRMPDRSYLNVSPFFLVNTKIVLYLGKRIFYKNFNIVVEALKERKDLFLVMIGGNELDNAERAWLNKELNGRYKQYINISNEDLNILYNNAFCFIYPSRYEGFGIPIVEAMKCGCPVIASDINVFREIAKDGALFFNYEKKEELLETFVALENTVRRDNLIQEGLVNSKRFSWDKCFNETLDFYNEIYLTCFGNEFLEI